MNTEPFLASTFVPWTVNGPTALPHGEVLAAVDSSPSGRISATTSSGASTSAAPRARPRHPNGRLNGGLNDHPGGRLNGGLNDHPDGRLNGRPNGRLKGPPPPEPAGVVGPCHVATGKLPPVLHGRRDESSGSAIG